MIVSEFLHEALVNIGLIWCALISLPGLIYIVWRGIRKPCKRLLIWGVWKLDRAMKRAEMRRRTCNTFRVERISEFGYRIKTR